MKKQFTSSLLIFLAITATSMMSYANRMGYEACSLEEAEEKLCEVKMSHNLKEGSEICRALDNPKIVLRSANFIAGKLDGEFFCRSFTNVLTIKAFYRAGVLHGEYRDFSTSRSWHNIKTAWWIKYFNFGKQQGMEFLADEKGRVLEVIPGCWENGDRDSIYYANCLKLSYSEFDKEVRGFMNAEIKKNFAEMNRSVETKYDNGKIRFKANLVQGKFEGPYEKFYDTGKLQLKAQFKNGYPEIEEEFFEGGAKKSKRIYKNEKLTERTDYYENGKTSNLTKLNYDQYSRTEIVKSFSDNNKSSSEYTRRYNSGDYWGLYIGAYRHFDEDGVLLREEYYKDGKLDGKATFFGGDQRVETLWQMGVRKSKTIFNSDSGNAIEKVEYLNDGSEKSRIKLVDGHI